MTVCVFFCWWTCVFLAGHSPHSLSGLGGLSISITDREQYVYNPLLIDVFLKVYPFLLSCLHDAWRRFSVCLVLAFALHACRNVWSRRSLSVGCVAALWHLASEPRSSSGRLRAQRLLAMAAVKMYVEVKWKSQCLSVMRGGKTQSCCHVVSDVRAWLGD